MSIGRSFRWRCRFIYDRLPIMKFSYRGTAIALLCATIIVVILTWGNGIIVWDDVSHLSTKHRLSITKTNQQQSALVRSQDIRKLSLGKDGDKHLDDEWEWNRQEQRGHSEAKSIEDKENTLVLAKGNVCASSDMLKASSNIDTFNILQSISKGKNPEPVPVKDIKELEKEMSAFKGYISSNGLPLEVIVVPHSHSDPGWLKTVDEYFEEHTKHTLNNMVDKLLQYPNMTFIWAESVFLSLWWKDLKPDIQDIVRRLIQRKQLEIVVGSWVVPDEANPHYFALIDQMIEGHQWLEQNLGFRPKNIWSIDPFGYSTTLPYLYHMAGYDNMVICRVHDKVKESLQANKALEFYWRQYWDPKGQADIFTHVMPYKTYVIHDQCGPNTEVCKQFDFRKISGDRSLRNPNAITHENVGHQARLLLSQYIAKASNFKHNVLLIPLGHDFRYDKSLEWDQQYENYQKLFDHINSQNWNINARFGTIQTYFDELQKTMKKLKTSTEQHFPNLSGDFFPYTDQQDAYWTGYFTTRPFDKTLSRELEVNLRAAEIMNSIARGMHQQNKDKFQKYQENFDDLTQARQNLGLFQHHDGITGTEKAKVAVDYENRLINALNITAEVTRRSVAYILAKDKKHQKDIEGLLHMSNTKSERKLQPISNKVNIPKDGLDLILYNSIGRAKQELVQILIYSDRAEVTDDKGNIITSQINPVWTFKNTILVTVFELVFVADLKAISLATYHIQTVPESQNPRENYASYLRLYNHAGFSESMVQDTRFRVQSAVEENITIENGALRAEFSATSGYLQSLTTKPVIKTTKSELKFLMYKSNVGRSGAYIFSNLNPANDKEMDPRPMIRVLQGPVVSEVHVIQTSVNHTARLVNVTGPLGAGLEINNIVDIQGFNDKEMIMCIATDIKNINNTFYTDQNGLQTMKRERFENLRTGANYYPFTAHAYIEDPSGRFSILSAQPLGVSSQESGSLEVMLDRRLTRDDGRGLGEGVTDNKLTSSRFYILLERPSIHYMEKIDTNPQLSKNIISFPSLLAQILVEDLRYYAMQIYLDRDSKLEKYSHYEALTSDLPCDINLINLRALTTSPEENYSNSALILYRYPYTCAYPASDLKCSFDGDINMPVSVSLGNMFKDLKIKQATETMLSLMQNKQALTSADSYAVKLKPMDINTYKLSFG